MAANLAELQQQLAAERQRAATLQRESENLVGRLRAAVRRTRVSTAGELDRDLQRYQKEQEAIAPASLASWDNPAWKAFAAQTSNAPPFNMRVGFTREQAAFGETPAPLPHLLPLLNAQGGIIFLCDAATRDVARGMISSLLVRAAIAAPGQMRFSLIDPLGLGAAFPMRSLLPHVRHSGRTATDELETIIEDIRRINNSVVMMDRRLADLSSEKRSAELFEVIAAMDFPEAYSRDPRAVEHIVRIANSGPRAGRHLLVEFRVDKEKPRDLSLENFNDAVIVDCSRLTFTVDNAPNTDLLNEIFRQRTVSTARPVVGDWDQVVRPPELFAESSREKIETKLGERLVFWLGKDPDGTPCSHAILAGQAGFGKSSLLHVLITGLAARYSPEEIQFVLVDGKRGVEFQAYRTFPHAKVVCLQTSPAVALSVLKDFHDEMTDRFKLFSQEDVFDLIEYRNKTGKTLSRQVMIVDEYGVLLEADPDNAGRYLLDLLAKGRAAGTHLVLSSQNFDVKMMPAEFGQHIQLRASLFLPTEEVQRLAMFDAEGKRLIRELTSGGQVVLNDRSGRDDANSRGSVARLEPSNDRRAAVAKLVQEISTALPPGPMPIVLTGDECAELSSNPFIRQWAGHPPDALSLQETARKSVRENGFGIASWSAGDAPIPLWLGRKFDVQGHALAVLRRVPSHNLLVVGAETAYRLSMLASALAGLRSMLSLDGFEVSLLDGLADGLPGAGLLNVGLDAIEAAGANVARFSRDSAIAGHLESLIAAGSANRRGGRLLIVSEPEYFPDLYGGGGYGTPTGTAKAFKDLLRTGPQTGTHVIVTASSLAAVSNILHPSRDKSLFQHRIVQQMTQEESSTLFDSYSATHVLAQANHVTGALYVDAVQGHKAGQLFKSYCAGPTLRTDQTPAVLRENLGKLYPVKRES